MQFSLYDLINRGELPEEATAELPDEPTPRDPEAQAYAMQLKRKRRAMLLQQMLKAQGYEDLARMASVREQRG